MNRQNKIIGYLRKLSNIEIPLLSFMDKSLSKPIHGKVPAIFIIGLPRSGTTITYQTICSSFHVNYLSNFVHFLHNYPTLALRINNLLFKNHVSSFRSSEGFVKGLSGEAEGLQFWKRWQNVGMDEEQSTFDGTSNIYLQSSISSSCSFDNPFVSCFIGHLFCIEELYSSYPDAIFIRVKRNTQAIESSLLKCRKSRSNSKWFSVLPKGGDDVSHFDESSQISWQVRQLESNINKLDSYNNVFDIDYDRLCKEPNALLQEFYDFASLKGYALSKKGSIPLEVFKVR